MIVNVEIRPNIVIGIFVNKCRFLFSIFRNPSKNKLHFLLRMPYLLLAVLIDNLIRELQLDIFDCRRCSFLIAEDAVFKK